MIAVSTRRLGSPVIAADVWHTDRGGTGVVMITNRTTRRVGRATLAAVAVASLSLGAAACSDDDGNEDDIDNPVDGVDDQIDDELESLTDDIDTEVSTPDEP